MKRRAPWLLLASLTLAACGEEVNLDAVSGAKAGCDETPTAELNAPQAIMLPGRHCNGCHQEGGQADGLRWTAAGTVFQSASSKCNGGGVGGVEVKLADETGLVLITLVTNRTGNFYTREPLKFNQLQVQISKDGKTQRMSPQVSADCPTCHLPGGFAGARIYLGN